MKYRTGNAQLDALRAFARYETHVGGYRWAALTADGDVLCEMCVLADYRAHYTATRDDAPYAASYRIQGLINSGESDGESPEYCAACNRCLWGEME